MEKLRKDDPFLPALLSIVLLGAIPACSGKVAVDPPGGAGSGGGAGGESGEEPVAELYAELCEGLASCMDASFDQALCEASATCDSILRHHPGGDVFGCLSSSCSAMACADVLYPPSGDGELGPVAMDFVDRCVEALEGGCGVFEDFCGAFRLFTDEGLATMSKCFDLPSCDEVKICALETYAPCTYWLYQIEP